MEREIYDAFFRAEDRHWWFGGRRRILTAVLEQTFPRRDLEIADVGCGTGGMAKMLEGYGRVTGIDDAPEAREYCSKRGLERVLTPGEWKGTPHRYDLVTSFDVVEHVEDDVGFLRELAGRLKPDGRLLVTVPAYQFLWSVFDVLNHHKRRYTGTGLARQLTAAGFRVERMTHFNSILFPVIAAVRLAERVLKRGSTASEEHRRSVDRWFRVGPMNPILEGVFASERHWLMRGDLPVGCSILAVARPVEAASGDAVSGSEVAK